MTVKQITSDTADEKIKHLYETAFPEGEKIPWDDLIRLIEEMSLDFTAYYDGEEFIGFTIVYPHKVFNWFGTLPCVKDNAEKAMVSRYYPCLLKVIRVRPAYWT